MLSGPVKNVLLKGNNTVAEEEEEEEDATCWAAAAMARTTDSVSSVSVSDGTKSGHIDNNTVGTLSTAGDYKKD
jgi:hypothetical protein